MKLELSQLLIYARDSTIVVLALFFLCGSIWILSADPHAYAKALIPKLTHLKESPDPRLVIVGGSGSALGIDSQMIETATGLHTTNMGLYAGLGLQFMLGQVTPLLHSGDIVLILPEYELLQKPPTGDGYLLLEMVHANPWTIRDMINLHSMITVARAFPGWLRIQITFILKQHTIGLTDTRVLTLSGFNEYGDMMSTVGNQAHLTTEDVKNVKDIFVRPKSDPQTLALLKSFIAIEEEAGIHVFVSPPPLPKTMAVQYRTAITEHEAELLSVIGQEHLLGRQSSFIYADTDFLDDANHLTAAGRELRTKELLKFLVPSLKSNKSIY